MIIRTVRTVWLFNTSCDKSVFQRRDVVCSSKLLRTWDLNSFWLLKNLFRKDNGRLPEDVNAFPGNSFISVE